MLSKVERLAGGVAVAWLEGRLNVGGDLIVLEADLRKLVDSGVNKLVVDLSAVDHVDSAALGVLVGIAGALRANSGELKAAGLQRRVAEVFGITRLAKVIDIHPDVDSAARSFAA